MGKQKTTEQFIKEAITKHGDKYDYSKVVYTKKDNKIIIICKKHGDFEQCANSHLLGYGCQKCGGNYRYDTNGFIEKSRLVHGDSYDYSLTNYKNNQTKVIIICKIHGSFDQKPNNHLQGNGCPNCKSDKIAIKRKKPIEQFIEEANEKHGNKYDYFKVIYKNAFTNITICCKEHGEFLQTPKHHLRGQGCPFCVNKTEAKLYEKLQPLYPTLITQFKQEWCKKQKQLPFDFCIPEYKIIIELDGPQHFQQISNWSSPEEQFENDKYKEQCANDNGYSVIRLLQEDVFYDTYDWAKELCETIEEIKNGDEIANVYLCKNEEYNIF
jgi:very-short-patch-repair endonuclease